MLPHLTKRCLFFIIFLTYARWICGASFAFIHLGQELPPYLIDALTQIRLFNPKKPLYLLANSQALQNRSPLFDHLNVRYVPIESIPQSAEHKEFLQATLLKKHITTGFWVVTSERFLVLYDWMKQYNKKHVIHLENDTLFYADIDEFMPIFKQRYPGLAIVMDDDERCIPCFMYIANQKIMSKLARFFIEEVLTKPATDIWQVNDMVVIANFFKNQSRNDVNNLPIIMPSYVKTYGLKNTLGRYPKNQHSYYNNIHVFNSIFDGAALGQYLGGTHQGHPQGFINETTMFDPSKLQFVWKTDNKGRSIPYARCKGNYFRINNLHIHSKQLWKFTSVNPEDSINLPITSNGYNKTTFS